MVDLPPNAVLWSANSEIAKVQRQNMLNAIFLSFAGFFAIIFCFQILNILNLNHMILQIVISVAIAFLLWKQLLKSIKRMHLLNMVAIGKGHPWHPSEDLGSTSVFVSDAEIWHQIPANVRLFFQSESTKSVTILKKNDMNGKELLRWNHDPDIISKRVVSLINQALAIRDAQDRAMSEEDEDDPIERARVREEEEFYPVERVWQETAEGSLAPEPGALLRTIRTQGSDILKNNDE